MSNEKLKELAEKSEKGAKSKKVSNAPKKSKRKKSKKGDKSVKTSNTKVKAAPEIKETEVKKEWPKVTDKGSKELLGSRMTKDALKKVTPAQAQYWLDNRVDTRAIRTSKVAQLAEEMVLGRWISEACPPLCFTPDGRLCDGNHRLSSTVLADMEIEFYLREVPEDQVHVLDVGLTRSGGDVLFQKYPDLDKKQAQVLAVAVAWAKAYEIMEKTKLKKEQLRTIRIKKLSNFEYGEYLDSNPDLLESVEFISSVVPKTDIIFPAGQSSFIHYILSSRQRATQGVIDDWFTALYEGAGMKKGDALLVARERLIADRGRSARLSIAAKTALLIKAWNRRNQEEDVTSTQLILKAGKHYPLLK